MTKHNRILILVGQIFSLLAFAYTTFSYGLIAYYYQLLNDPVGEVTARVFAYLSLVEVIMAIIGIASANRPISRFKNYSAIVSASFNGVYAIFMLVTLSSLGSGVSLGFLDYVLILGMPTTCILLIIGAVKAHEEKKDFQPPVYIPNPPILPVNETSPTGVNEPVEEIQLSGKAAEELSKLKKLYEYKLISEQEYQFKKRKILDHEFSGK